MRADWHTPEGVSRAPGLRDLAAVFFRHRKLFVVCFAAVLAGGILYGALAASYSAHMKVLVRRGRIDPAITPTQTVVPLLQSEVVSEEELNSEVELLRDPELLREVVANAGLAKQNSWLAWLWRETPEEAAERAARRMAKRLEIVPVRKSQIISASYRAHDPRLAASVLKSLGEIYLARRAHVGRPGGQQAFFDEQLQVARQEVLRAQRNLEGFMRGTQVASAPLERDLMLQKLSEAQATEFALEASVAELMGKAQALDEKIRQLPERRVSQVRNADNPQLQEKLKSKLLELELRRTTLLTKFQSSYRLVQEVDQQIAQAKAALEAENLTPLRDEVTEDNPDHAWADSERVKTGVELEALQRRLAAAKEQVTTYQTRAQRLTRSAIEQSDLEQRLKSAEEKYLLYTHKREEARISDALDRNGILNVAIAAAPQVPALPTTPLWLSCCFAMLAAFAASTAAVLAVDYLDPSLRTPAEVASLLGIPVVACLPAPMPRAPKQRAA